MDENLRRLTTVSNGQSDISVSESMVPIKLFLQARLAPQ